MGYLTIYSQFYDGKGIFNTVVTYHGTYSHKYYYKGILNILPHTMRHFMNT